MLRTILFLTLGTFGTALLISVSSVYLFHDVDHDKIGHLNQAFAGLCVESGAFALIIGAVTGMLTAMGKPLLRLDRFDSRTVPGLSLGAVVTVCQYPWELIARKFLPQMSDLALMIYLIIAPILCAAVLLRDGFNRRRLNSV